MFKVFFKELLFYIKERSLSKKVFKCLLFYLLSSLASSLIKDTEAAEEYAEVASYIFSQDDLF